MVCAGSAERHVHLVPSHGFWLMAKEEPKTLYLHSLANFPVFMLVNKGMIQNDLEDKLIVPDAISRYLVPEVLLETLDYAGKNMCSNKLNFHVAGCSNTMFFYKAGNWIQKHDEQI